MTAQSQHSYMEQIPGNTNQVSQKWVCKCVKGQKCWRVLFFPHSSCFSCRKLHMFSAVIIMYLSSSLPLTSDCKHPLKHNPDAQISNLVSYTPDVTCSNLSLPLLYNTHTHACTHAPLFPLWITPIYLNPEQNGKEQSSSKCPGEKFGWHIF